MSVALKGFQKQKIEQEKKLDKEKKLNEAIEKQFIDNGLLDIELNNIKKKLEDKIDNYTISVLTCFTIGYFENMDSSKSFFNSVFQVSIG